MRARLLFRVLAAANIAVSLLTPGTGQAWAAPAPPPSLPLAQATAPAQAADAGHAGGVSRTVTLITGDRISVSTDGQYTVAPVAGEKLTTTLVQRQAGGHHVVIPVGVLGMVSSGQLDQRLFDLEDLTSFGYDDRSGDLPLLVTYPEGKRAGLSPDGMLGKVGVTREMPAARMVAVRQHRATATAAWNALTTVVKGQRTLRAGIEKIWMDGKAKLSLSESVPQIGAPAAWKAGYKGTGVTVGLVDSGLDDTHPDLAGRVVDRVDLTTEADNLDHAGHGTHVASIIGGNGAAANGKYTGVAPDVKFAVAKACIADTTCSESAVIAGMEWLAGKGIKVVNMSLGGTNQDGLDPTEQALESLTAKYGTLFVVATGNDGGWVSSPASAPSALAVGAVDKKDVPAKFSNHGIRQSELAVKPEVAAPGVDITAARSKDSADDGPYIAHSGTSMAAPHVAGTAALLLQEHPDWTWNQLKDSIVSTAKGDDENWFTEGAGRVDAGRAVTQPAYASPATITFGQQDWPHDKPTAAQTITYHNAGVSPLTLNLTINERAANKAPVPAGLYTVSPTIVTVPAGGVAAAQVTGNPQLNPPGNTFLGGSVNATGDGVTLRTPLMMATLPQMHTLTVVGIDRAGAPPTKFLNTWWPMGRDAQQSIAAPQQSDTTVLSGSQQAGSLAGAQRSKSLGEGVVTYQLEAGDYNLDQIQPKGEDDYLLVAPRVVLDKDVTITMDARQAKPWKVTPPRADAALQAASVGYEYKYPTAWAVGDVLFGSTFDHMFTAQVGPSDPLKLFYADAQAAYLKQRVDGSTVDSPFYYHLAWSAPAGSYFTGATKTFDPRKIAKVRAHYATPFAGATVDIETRFRRSWDHARWQAVGSSITKAMTRDEYYDRETNFVYEKDVTEHKGINDDGDEVGVGWHSPELVLTAGLTREEQWGRGVFGPGFMYDPRRGPSDYWEVGLDRTGDAMSLRPSLLSDSASRSTDSFWTTGQSSLKRNGTTIAKSTSPELEAKVPADAATYEFSSSVSVPKELDTISSSVSATWTFSSAHTAAEAYLPASAVRFTPRLDDDNRAPAGRLFTVPFTVQHQPRSTAGRTTSFDVQVSSDDGKTWAKAAYFRSGDQGALLVDNPRGHGFVSIKASAKDAAGNEVKQTIIRAYRY
jgi:subtilisin family serine protease